MPSNSIHQFLLSAPKTILIVEDEFAVADDLQLILEKAGYRVSGIAFTVVEALWTCNKIVDNKLSN